MKLKTAADSQINDKSIAVIIANNPIQQRFMPLITRQESRNSNKHIKAIRNKISEIRVKSINVLII